MKTHAIFFPFDLFGHAGARTGTELLADAVQEMLRDNRREKVPTRARAYANKVRVEELLLDTDADYRTWRAGAREAIAPILKADDFLLWATGNHLGCLPLYDELTDRHASTLVIQFDAHLDIYNLSDCATELSHGNFLLHSAGPLPNIINLGHREQLLRPDYIAKTFRAAFSAAELHRDPAPALATLKQRCADAERIIIDLDCDVFDAAFFPAVAQPEPFGLAPAFVLNVLNEIWCDRIRGLAISEFVPAHDDRDRSLATLLWLIEWVFLRKYEK